MPLSARTCRYVTAPRASARTRYFPLAVKNDDGSVTTWGFAGGAPGQLMRRGITKDQLKIGETIVVEGFRAKDGTHTANGRTVKFADGREFFVGAEGTPVLPGGPQP